MHEPQTSRILVIDDDRELCEMLSEYLAPEAFELSVLHDGGEALDTLASEAFDLIILDVMLPGMNGIEILRRLRKRSSTPVLMLTARGDDVDRIVGLELGADDYLAKPFNPRELVARLRAILRRTGAVETDDDAPLLAGDLRLRPRARKFELDGRPVRMTGTEMRIVELLMRHHGDVVEKETLYKEALGRHFSPFDRSLDTHVSNLRRKLGPAPDGEPRIVNERGIGYMLRRIAEA